MKSGFLKITFKTFLYLFVIRKIGGRKTLSSQKKFGLVSRKVFFFYFGWKILSRGYQKFRNVILFADYNKFGSQTFNCYIFCFESCFFNFIH
jgi:hypothetical protein